MRYIFFLFCLCIPILTHAQIDDIIRQETKPVLSPLTQETIYAYDSLRNISFHDESSEYKKYIGQDIFFYKRASSHKPDMDTVYYNFKLLIPDTVWYHKKRIPKLFKDYVVYTAYQGLKHGYDTTPASEIEGRVFRIVDIIYNVYRELILTLESPSSHQQFQWIISKSNVSPLKSSFPGILVGFYKKIKDEYVGKEYIFNYEAYLNKKFEANYGQNYAYSIDINTLKRVQLIEETSSKNDIVFQSVDIGIIDFGNEYQVPYLVLEDSLNNRIGVRLSYNPTLGGCVGRGLNFNSDLSPINSPYTIGSLLDYESVKQIRANKLAEEQEKNRIENEKRLQQEQHQKEKEAQHLADCIKKFGKSLGSVIANGRVKIGMSKEQCEWAWGFPEDTNRTSGSFGTHEQWVYGSGNYLYFENGRLSAIQN